MPFALAADHVLAREDVVLNPYYGHMGGLYGSEYWTYLLPRRVGEEMTAALTSAPFEPLGARRAVEIGLIDDAFGDTAEQFRAGVRRFAEQLASSPARLAAARREAPLTRPRRATPDRSPPTAPTSSRDRDECFFGADRQLPRGPTPIRLQARKPPNRRTAGALTAPRRLTECGLAPDGWLDRAEMSG